jgi:hypothetical protein
MSGEKEVRLRQNEYRRLMAAARLVEAVGERDDAVRRKLAAAEERIEEQGKIAERQKRQFDSLVESTRQRFAQLDERDAASQAYAEQWLQGAEAVIAHIRDHQPHEKFAPGKLEALEQDARISRENIRRGEFAAAVATAQALYRQARQAHAGIADLQAAWDDWLARAEKSAATLLAELDAQKIARWIIASDEDENGGHEMDAEIDYWSEGALSALCAAVREREETLRGGAAALGVEDLKKVLAVFDEARSTLTGIVEQAKERQFSSIVRANIAQTLADSLAEDGWQVVDGAWEGAAGDARGGLANGYHLKLQDVSGNGNEIVAIVTPEAGDDGKMRNTVRFAYFARDNNDTRFAARQTARLNERLHDLQLAEGDLRCVQGHEHTHRGDERRRDFEAVRAGKGGKPGVVRTGEMPSGNPGLPARNAAR